MSDKVDKMVQLAILNEIQTRNRMISRYFDKERDIYTECGLPDTEELTPQHYYNMYDREPIAARVVGMMPDECWLTQPELIDNKARVNSEFINSVKDAANSLDGESWYEQDGMQSIWELLRRADELSGIGSFGGILLGIDDGQTLDKPVATIDVKGRSIGVQSIQRKLLYAQVYYEPLVSVREFEIDRTNPRFGLPKSYNIQINDPNVYFQGAYDTKSVEVHWTRFVHLGDDKRSSRTFGTPRQRAVWNNLLNLQKLYAGSAEMYYQGALPGLSFETHPELGFLTLDDDARKEFREQMERYRHRLQRHLRTTGMSVNPLAPQVVDPSPQIERQLEAISIKKAVPKRIFMGSERGELSSGQDANEWDGKLMGRQQVYVSPDVCAPFFNRLIQLRVAATPKGKYSLKWPDLTSMTENERATIAMKRIQAASRYMAEEVYKIMRPEIFLVRELGYTEDEAKEMVKDLVLPVPGEDLEPKGPIIVDDADGTENDDDDSGGNASEAA